MTEHDSDRPTQAPGPHPGRNLALELVRVTEAAALAAARWVGRGDKDGADGVAVDAMRKMISTVQMKGVVVIGEGEKDNAPMLFNGEEVGDGTGPECDVAVDPIDGTTLTSVGLSDITPIRPFARSVVMVEQVVGLAYVAMVVSRLVALTVQRPRG